MKLKKIILALFCTILLASCSKLEPAHIVLDEGWLWASSNNPRSDFQSANTLEIASIVEKLPNRKGYIWLKNYFYVDLSLKERDLAVYLGKVEIAAEVFINGVSVGTFGEFPPHEFGPGTGATYFRIPKNAIHQNGTNQILIKLWTNGGGGIQEVPVIGPLNYIENKTRHSSFLLSDVNMMFASVVFVIAMFYLFIYFNRKKDKEYLNYAFMNIFSSMYILPYFLSSTPWRFPMISYLAFQKIFYGIVAFADMYFATSFMLSFIKVEYGKRLQKLRILLFVVPVINILFLKDLRSFSALLPVLFIFGIIQLMFAVVPITKGLFNADRQVFLLIAGFVPVEIGVVADLFVHVIFRRVDMPMFSVWGWQFTTSSFLIILAVRFARALNESEHMAASLESQVTERTKELKTANESLKEKQAIAEREMKLAVHVQESIYPHNADVGESWDVAVYFKPFAGVSGDLYDFYTQKDDFVGMSLFDVSGHGIAAGLVTMLSKNVIFRNFIDNRQKPLPQVMYLINDGIIRTKGDIENYLTGIVVRVEDALSGKMALVNAGSPPPLLYKQKAKKAIPLLPDEKKQQKGMIGVAGISVSFQQLDFVMEEGDTLLLYTDGITEGRNPFGVDYGQDRLLESLSHCGDGSAESRLSLLLRDFTKFTGGVQQPDDITLIVLKRLKYTDPHAQKLADAEALLESLEGADDADELEELEELEELDEI